MNLVVEKLHFLKDFSSNNQCSTPRQLGKTVWVEQTWLLRGVKKMFNKEILPEKKENNFHY